MCMPNSDWSNAPCYARPGLNVTKEQMQKDWAGYYAYKGAQWMEMKRTEMTNETTNGLLKAWVCAGPSNYDVWQYYYLNGQAQSIAWPTNGPNCDIPPLQQLKVGEKIGEIECGYDKFLLVNKESDMPACIKLANISKLLDRGWEHLATYLNDTVQHSPVTTLVYITGQDLPYCNTCQGKSENLTVIIGANNTLRWINNAPIPLWFFTLPNNDDIAFSNSAIFPLVSQINTMKFPAYLYSEQSFEYTFTKSGKFFWHTTPQFMGWVTVLSPQLHPMTYLKNYTGVVTLGSQTYYFETPQYTHDAYFNSPQISFHDVIFTLFPSGFRGGLPVNACGGQYYWADAKFSDNTSELLHIFAPFQQCAPPQPPIYFGSHTNPQAGLTFYDGKMKLLVSTSVTNSSN